MYESVREVLDVSHLQARYLKHLQSSEYSDWPQQYVQLALVKEERVTRTDSNVEEITRLTLQGQIDEVLLRKEPLYGLSDIFHYQNKPCPRIILILGGPGEWLKYHNPFYYTYNHSNKTVITFTQIFY